MLHVDIKIWLLAYFRYAVYMVIDLMAAKIFKDPFLLNLSPNDVWYLRTNTGPQGVRVHINPGEPGASLKNWFDKIVIVSLTLNPELVLCYHGRIIFLFRAVYWWHYDFIQPAVNLFQHRDEVLAVDESSVQLSTVELQAYLLRFYFDQLQMTGRYRSFELQRLVYEIVYLLQIRVQMPWNLGLFFFAAPVLRILALNTDRLILLLLHYRPWPCPFRFFYQGFVCRRYWCNGTCLVVLLFNNRVAFAF